MSWFGIEGFFKSFSCVFQGFDFFEVKDSFEL